VGKKDTGVLVFVDYSFKGNCDNVNKTSMMSVFV